MYAFNQSTMSLRL